MSTSDPTPEEIATLMARLRRLGLKLLRDTDISTVRDAATALASLQRRAETAERERDALSANWAKELRISHEMGVRTEKAESRLAALEKVVEKIADARPEYATVAELNEMASAALSQLAEKGGDKT